MLIRQGKKRMHEKNGYRTYVDIMTGENCRQFSLLTELPYWPVCSSSRMGVDGVKEVEGGNR